MCCAWDGGWAEDRGRDSIEDDDGAVKRAIAAKRGCLDEDADFVDDDAGFAAEGDDFADEGAVFVDAGFGIGQGSAFPPVGHELVGLGDLGVEMD